MRRTCLAIVALFFMTGLAAAQDKPRIEKADDVPRFSYPVSGDLTTLVRDDKAFAAFAAPLRRDIESILDGYQIDDKATQRGLLGVLAQLDFLEGRYDDAQRRLDTIRDLQEKPADKLLSGLRMYAMIAAARSTGSVTSEAYRDAVAANVAQALAALPYPVIGNDIREAKAGVELQSETLILGRIQEQLQPIADKAHALSSDVAPAIVGARYAIQTGLPLKDGLARTFTAYLDAHKVTKPDIWKSRDVALPAGQPYQPVDVVIWDSGIDTELFPGRVELDGKRPAVIGFDRYDRPANTELAPIPPAFKPDLAAMLSRIKGFSDMEANIDTPEADGVKQYLAALKPDEYKHAVEELSFVGDYVHGTHVTGITMAGNPYARVAVARIEFSYTIQPDPCPSDALAKRDAQNTAAYIAFMKRHHARVVNMSWGGSLKSEESELEQCNMGKTVEERRALARRYFDLQRDALTRGIASAPEILFVAAAGNEDSDATFDESIPAGIELPNLISVGAVDQAGDEASFTSYGKTVVVDASGYLVDSVVPGGMHLALSGTSMAAPQVSNLAAKLLAVNPKLTPVDLIRIIRSTATPSEDGRRHLIDPARAVALVQESAPGH